MRMNSSDVAADSLTADVWTHLSDLNAGDLVRLGAASFLLLALKIPTAVGSAASLIAAPLRRMHGLHEYRAQYEPMAVLNNHLRRDVGLHRRGAPNYDVTIWDTF